MDSAARTETSSSKGNKTKPPVNCAAVTGAVDRSMDRLASVSHAAQHRIIAFYMLVDTRRMPADFAPSLSSAVMSSFKKKNTKSI